MQIEIKNVVYRGLLFGMKKGDHRQLLEDSTVEVHYMRNNELTRIKFNIEKGFLFDGASVPKFARWFLKSWHDTMFKNIPALVHDMIFVYGGDNLDKQIMSFEEANELYKALNVYCKTCSKFKSRIAYKAVSSCIGKTCYRTTSKYDVINQSLIKWNWK